MIMMMLIMVDDDDLCVCVRERLCVRVCVYVCVGVRYIVWAWVGCRSYYFVLYVFFVLFTIYDSILYSDIYRYTYLIHVCYTRILLTFQDVNIILNLLTLMISLCSFFNIFFQYFLFIYLSSFSPHSMPFNLILSHFILFIISFLICSFYHTLFIFIFIFFHFSLLFLFVFVFL